MTRYRSQPELLAALESSRRRLTSLLTRLAPADYSISGVVGSWNAKDLLAHLAAWQRLLLEWYAQGKSGQALIPSPTGRSRLEIDQLNAQIYENSRVLPLEQVHTEFKEAFTAVTTLAASLREEELFHPGYYAWTGELLLADYVAANTCQHDDWTARMLRRWLQQQYKL